MHCYKKEGRVKERKREGWCDCNGGRRDWVWDIKEEQKKRKNICL